MTMEQLAITFIEPELHACPFCGGAASFDYGGGYHWVVCGGCGASSTYVPDDGGKDKLAAIWNKRVGAECPHALALTEENE